VESTWKVFVRPWKLPFGLGVRTRGGVEVTFRVGFCSRLVVMSSSRIHVCLQFRFGLAAVLRRLAALSSMD